MLVLFSFYIFHILIDSLYIKSYSHLFDLLLINYKLFFFFIQHYSNQNHYK